MKNKKRRFFKRVSFFLVFVVSCVSFFCLSVSAGEITYAPVDDYFLMYCEVRNKGLLASKSVSQSVTGNNDVTITITPKEPIDYVNVYGLMQKPPLSLSSEFQYYLDFDFQIGGSYAWYFKTASVYVTPYDFGPGITSVYRDYNVEYIDGAYRVRGSIPFTYNDLAGGFYGFGVEFNSTQSLDSVRVVVVSAITIRSKDKDMAQTDEITGAIDGATDEITGAIDQATDKFFEEQYTPPDTGAMDDLGSAEDTVNDNNSAGLNNANQYHASAITVLSQYVGGFQVLSAVVGKFTDIPFFAGLLTLSISVGLFAFLLGMLSTALAFHGRNSDRRGRRRGG